MSTLSHALRVFSILAIAAGCSYLITSGSERFRENVRKEYRVRMEQLQYNDQMIEAHFQWERQVKLDEIGKAHSVELVNHLGGPVEAAFKHPRRSTQSMLSDFLAESARACSLSVAASAVHVDRFSEFEAVFDFHSQPDGETMARASKLFLQHCSPYMFGIRFVCNGALVAELNRAAIESVPDWKTADLAEIAGMIEKIVAARDVAEKDANSLTPPREPSEPQKRFDRAIDDFNSTVAENYKRLNAIIQKISDAANLKDVREPHDITPLLKTFPTDREIKSLSRFFLSQEDLLRERIAKEQFDPLVVEIAVRPFRKAVTDKEFQLADSLGALDHYRKVTDEFLRGISKPGMKWKIESKGKDGKMMQFESTEARDRYDRLKELVTKASDGVGKSIDALARD